VEVILVGVNPTPGLCQKRARLAGRCPFDEDEGPPQASGAVATVGAIPVGAIPVEIIPVGVIPVGEIAVDELPVGDSPVEEISMGEISIGVIPVGGTPVGTIPVGEITVGEIPVGVNAVARPRRRPRAATHAFCVHQSRCVVCDASFRLCTECRLASGDGEAMAALCAEVQPSLVFLDFDR